LNVLANTRFPRRMRRMKEDEEDAMSDPTPR
jgi:hypothetical protein